MRAFIKIMTVLLLCSVFFISCKKHKESDYHSVIEKIEAEGKHYKGTSISSEEYIAEKDLIEVTEGDKTFLIPERKKHLTMYECTECHAKPLAEMRDPEVLLPRSHWDIEIVHGDAKTMNCLTCHSGANMNNLHSLTGEAISFNKSYQVCAQCHTSQFKDWKGGAHGKNISGWAPPRAINSCVNCHNPHQPKFNKRWPEVFNVHKELQRK
ncbi:cytochrome c3 family protein [Galbibacter mesophilus]|uniref:cytochrome c3 family protein n=1 Tax=Galbibacter mesophilus TaxID=379069 RepID=UPI00191DEE39|nr:cytochrome c3 family protein [Galbibacter mesophilus]MCM5663912.1 cytochrome C [Galbibacter mesophilus]